MQIEIDDENELAVRGDIHGRRKIAERRLAEHAVILRRVFPDQTKRPPMRDRDVVELSIRRDDDTVWPVDVHRHVAGSKVLLRFNRAWTPVWFGLEVFDER